MSQVIPLPEPLAPVRKSVVVPLTPERAFRLFTEGLSTWWPLASHSISDERAASCGLEPCVGGAIYELRDDGERFAWGTVEVWEPPARFVMRWYPGRDAATGQQVEVRFSAAPGGTRVDLEHRDWERLAERAEAARTSYDGGWDLVLGARFVDACRAAAGSD
ncbi:MAG: SRPBCC domain-containing protein [Deltaproteobacteria bacterium]|nr:SRPBCC domain-containing protein [Deltaproteobacteria bacterium]